MGYITDLKCCPKCGDDYGGVYRKVKMSGNSEYNYSFDGGEEADNSHLHDGLSYKSSASIYCRSCDARIGKAKKE